MSLGAFAVVAARERELGAPVTLENLAGFGWERPFLGVSMWVFMLGFLGFPLTGGFIGKFYVFAAAYERGWWWLIVVGVVATMICGLLLPRRSSARCTSATRVELQLAPAGGSPPRELLLGLGVALCVVVTVGSFFAVQPLIDVARQAAATRCPLLETSRSTAWRDAAQAARRAGRRPAARLEREHGEAGDQSRGPERRQRVGLRGG